MAVREKETTPVCEWFALCANPAIREEPHPILGAVPICDRCSKKLEAMG